jgi:hypothetical protein
MSKIQGIIPAQQFEVVRDRIGEIIADELANQVDLTNNSEIDAEVFIERVIPFDKTDFPAINVALAKGDNAGKTYISSDWGHIYYIDVYCSGKANNSDQGDKRAILKLQKLIGIIRFIFESPYYKTLGFTAPSIQRVGVKSFFLAQPDKDDAGNTVMGRVELNVEVPEGSETISGVVAAGYETKVKLAETDKGYKYIKE